MSDIDDTPDDFRALLGAFGSHASGEKRARAERMAVMKPGDGRRRRGAPRTLQLNVRVTDVVKLKADNLAETMNCSLADVIEAAIGALEKQRAKTKSS